MRKSKRYDVSELVEAQFEPGSKRSVLKNLLGISNKFEMEDLEAQALEAAIELFLKRVKRNHRFTGKEICEMHGTWLGNIYPWAGRYRQVQMSKGNFAFASARHIPTLMQEFEKNQLFHHTPCIFKETSRVVRALAEVHVELILIHPFREGNGRLARLLSTLMGKQAGLGGMDFEPIIGKHRNRYFSAVRSGMGKDYVPMEKLFEEVIRRTTS